MVLSFPNPKITDVLQATSQPRNNLELRLKCDRWGQTVIHHHYATYPLSVSPVFRLEDDNSHRAYVYGMSISPGLLAGDELNISLQLAENSSLYLTDQSATKVHSMPIADTKAIVHYNIEIGAGATLELIPEPLILFDDAALDQTLRIQMHPTGALCLSEIVLPGRLARGESYQFRHYTNRLQVSSTSGKLWFKDASYLTGKNNSLIHTSLFATLPVLGSLIVVLPSGDLEKLSAEVENPAAINHTNLTVASSILPHGKGLIIRAIASSTSELKTYLKYALNCVRRSRHQSLLPDSL